MKQAPENPSCHVSYLDRLLQILLPDGQGFAAMMEAYFDESGTHSGSPAMCVAGYLFDAEQCRLFDDEWKLMLKRFGLEYFHMAECAAGTGEFSKLTAQERIEAETRAIGIIKRRITVGFVASGTEPEFNKYRPE